MIDISPEQPNAAAFELYAFCGGQAKTVGLDGLINENGTGPVFDNTVGALALKANVELVQATIIADRERPGRGRVVPGAGEADGVGFGWGAALALAACEAFKAANPGYVASLM